MTPYTYHCDNCGRGTTAEYEITYTDPDAATNEITRGDQQWSTVSNIVCAACVREEYHYITETMDPEAELLVL